MRATYDHTNVFGGNTVTTKPRDQKSISHSSLKKYKCDVACIAITVIDFPTTVQSHRSKPIEFIFMMKRCYKNSWLDVAPIKNR